MEHSIGSIFVLTAVTCCVIVPLSSATSVPDWNYNETSPIGPSHWSDHYGICGNTYQSPINVVSTALTSIALQNLTLTGYSDATVSPSFTLTNNGHSAQVSVKTKSIKITGFGLGATYVLEQFHFHWGDTSATGSEHTVDGKHYPLEIHLVHYNADKYNNVSEAASNTADTTALAVLGVFVDVTSQSKQLSTELNKLIDNVTQIPHEGDTVTVQSFALNDIIPCDYSMYRYNGSLTTPGCAEVVIWTVFSKPIYVTEAQMSKLRNMYSNPETETDVKLTSNYRPTQPVNTRTVYKYTDAYAAVRCTAPSALSTGSSVSAMIMALLVCSSYLLS